MCRLAGKLHKTASYLATLLSLNEFHPQHFINTHIAQSEPKPVASLHSILPVQLCLEEAYFSNLNF